MAIRYCKPLANSLSEISRSDHHPALFLTQSGIIISEDVSTLSTTIGRPTLPRLFPFKLLNCNVIIPLTSNGQSSGNSVIPDWVRNNAGWWSERLISDKEFANGLQYLIANGIISV